MLMARPREHLKNAPIVEAVIDFRVVPQGDVSGETFGDLRAAIGEKYTRESSIQSIEARFGIVHGTPLKPWQMQTDLGYRYKAETEIVQFRVDGFTFSKLARYTTWGEVSSEAFRLWNIYLDLAKPRQVSRIAVRYINRMRLANVKELGEYLTEAPKLPLPAPQRIREFLTRVYVDDDRRKASAIMVQALEPQIDPESISLLLDIDAFCEINEMPGDLGLLSAFGKLRDLKNEIFFASITEKIVEMYA
jgi:uncharacterized protein (TIGR04255 family)